MNATVKEYTFAQGSDDWRALREQPGMKSASEAPVMMGAHPNMKRNELLHAKATLSPKEYSSYVQDVIFTEGHRAEAATRPIVEDYLGEDLLAITCSRGEYIASYDGVNSLESYNTSWEHKQYNEKLVAAVTAAKDGSALPPYIYWQLEHQLLVNPRIQRVIFTCGDGTIPNTVMCTYRAFPGRREALLAGWMQFEKDLAEYKPKEKAPTLVGKPVPELPMLTLDVAGELAVQDNRVIFLEKVNELIASVKTDLKTDQDFADAETMAKRLKEAEDRIDRVIEDSIAKVQPLADAHAALRQAQESMRACRLPLANNVKNRKQVRKGEIVQAAENKLKAAIAEAEREFAEHGVKITFGPVDFLGATKNKRSFDNMESDCDDLLARAKIQLTELRDKIRTNLNTLLTSAKDHLFLFSKRDCAYMDPELLRLTIESKIREYKDGEAQKDAARIQKHKDAIAGIRAAATFPDDVDVAELNIRRMKIKAIKMADLQEFAEEAAKAATETLNILNAKIQAIEDAQQRKANLETNFQRALAHVTGCGDGLIGGQPAAYGLLLAELDDMKIDPSFNQSQKDALDGAIASTRLKVQKAMEEQSRAKPAQESSFKDIPLAPSPSASGIVRAGIEDDGLHDFVPGGDDLEPLHHEPMTQRQPVTYSTGNVDLRVIQIIIKEHGDGLEEFVGIQTPNGRRIEIGQMQRGQTNMHKLNISVSDIEDLYVSVVR